ncbi:MAG TPA: NUDIX hydrolase [Planctomycetota bacterium]|nr:NUDIX hydrolase [Planctomycetota bacterium]
MADRRVQRGVMLEMVTEEVTLPNGRTTALDLIRHPGASAVVPFLDDERVLLIRQYRYAAGGTIYEVPAGKLDAGEAPETCARRELEEETGYRAARFERLATIWTTPGFTDERIHLFAARELTRGTQRLDHDEMIELVPMTLAEALDRVWSGEISDAKTALALVHAAQRTGRFE